MYSVCMYVCKVSMPACMQAHVCVSQLVGLFIVLPVCKNVVGVSTCVCV